MSVVHDRLQRNSVTPQGTWFLRIPDGSIYGPVSLQTLCEWATQSRIAPDNEVSRDRQEWIPAPQMPELKMEWIAWLPDGSQYGPFNLLAVPHLVQQGHLPLNAVLSHGATGKTRPVHELVKPSDQALVDQPEIAAEHEQKWQRMYQEAKRSYLLHEAELQKTIDTLQSQTEQSEHRIQETQSQIKNYESVQAECERLQAFATQLESDFQSIQATLKATEDTLAEQRQVNLQLSRESAVREKTVMTRVEELERKLQSATQQLHERQEAIRKAESDAHTTPVEVDTSWQNQLREQERLFNERLDGARQETAILQKQLTALQVENQKLTRQIGEQTQRAELRSRTESSALAKAQQQAETLQAAFEKAREEAEAAAERCQGATRETERLKLENQRLSDRAAAREQQLNGQLEQLREQLTEAKSEVTRIQGAVAEDRSHGEALWQQARENEAQLAAKLTAFQETSGARILELEQERDALKADISNDRQARTEAEADAAHRIKVLEETIISTQAEQAALEQALNEARSATQAEIASGREKESKAAASILDLTSRLEEARQHTIQAEQAQQNTLATLAKVEARLKNANHQLQSLTKELTEKQSTAGTLSVELERLRDDTTAQRQELERQLERSSNELAQVRNQDVSLTESLEREKQSMAALTDRFNEQAAELELVRGNHQVATSAAETANQHIQQLTRQLEDTRQSLQQTGDKHRQQAEAWHTERCALETARQAAEQSLHQAEATVASLTARLDQQTAELDQIRAGHQAATSDATTADQRIQQLSRQLEDARQSLQQTGDEHRQQAEAWHTERRALETARQAAEQSLHQAEASAASLTGRANEQTAEIRELKHQLAAATAHHAKQAATIHHLQEEIQQLDVASAALKESLVQENELEAELRSKTEKQESELQAAIHLLESKVGERNNQLQQAERDLQQLQQEHQKLSQLHASTLRDLEALRSDSAAAAMLLQARQHEATLTAKVSQLESRLAQLTASRSIRPAYRRIRPQYAALGAAWLLCILVAYRIGGHSKPSTSPLSTRPLYIPQMDQPAPREGAPPGQPASPPLDLVDPEPSPAEAPLATTPANPEAVPQEPDTWPSLDLPDVRVQELPNGRALIFDFGLFTSMTNLSPRSQPALREVADLLRPHMSRFKLIVEGHTDTVPVSSAHTSLDNHALAMSRASLVARLLTGPMALPANLVFTTSAGELDPPFSNFDDSSRIKNRTVVLKLIPR